MAFRLEDENNVVTGRVENGVAIVSLADGRIAFGKWPNNVAFKIGQINLEIAILVFPVEHKMVALGSESSP